MSAVAGIRRTMKELVDGTIRVQIDIEPTNRDSFLKLFPSIDMPVAMAPLNPGYTSATVGVEGGRQEGPGEEFDELHPHGGEIGQIATFVVNDAESKELGGSTWTTLGPLTQSAIMLAKNEAFQRWVAHVTGHANDGVLTETIATDYIRSRCEIESRKELDSDPKARKAFQRMMAEYRAWVTAQ